MVQDTGTWRRFFIKKLDYNILAIKTIMLSVFGLYSLPLLATVVQYIDSVVGFSTGQGYHTESSRYIFESPLIYIWVILCIYILGAMLFLIYNNYKGKR